MNQKMLERHKYEKNALDDHSEWEDLDFFEFIKKSPYDDFTPRKDTFYDADLYHISINTLQFKFKNVVHSKAILKEPIKRADSSP